MPCLPQQEPGPAQDPVPGCDPQQVVSPVPGRDWAAFPVRLEVAAIFFSV